MRLFVTVLHFNASSPLSWLPAASFTLIGAADKDVFLEIDRSYYVYGTLKQDMDIMPAVSKTYMVFGLFCRRLFTG